MRAGLDSAEGATQVVVTVEADVPPLGLWGPGLHVRVSGHATQETLER